MNTYLIYGIKDNDLESARDRIERALGIKLVGHESSYHGGNYYRFGSLGNEHFVLQHNFDPIENEWNEEDHKCMPMLLYVNETKRPEEIEKILQNKGIYLLKKEAI